MGNSYSIYSFSYHIFSDSTILPIGQLISKRILHNTILKYSFNVSYYFNTYYSFTVPKSADFTVICESQQISLS